ncbi:MAG: serpin family protein [SAR202 cluster bacterium]|nr:serpin family protein [SAR202 cluster bacterium]
MGMGVAFTAAADFSGMGLPNLALSRVVHKAVVDVNEVGTEAAAVTVVGVETTAVVETVDFTVDRPFYVAIVDDQTGSLLFVGAIHDPTG